MENEYDYKSTGIIAKIFEDHFSCFYSKYQIQLDELRPNALIEVQKIIDCSNHNLGACVYVCPHCGFSRLVPQSEFKKMTEETFQNNKLFICDNCKIRMNPTSIEDDF